MPPTYFQYVKAFVTKHMVLYSSLVPITRLARKCQRRGTDAAGVLLVRQGICDEAHGALFVRLVLFAGEERPYHRDNNQGYYESYQNQTGTSFNIVHEFVSARAKYQGVRRSTYRSCECAGCCNSDSHQNCLRVSA